MSKLRYDEVVPLVNGIIAQYEGMRLTLRQLFYRLVAAQAIENTQAKYKALGRQLVKARMEGDVPFEAIEDRTRSVDRAHGGDLGAAEHFNLYWDYVTNMGSRYTMPKWWGQPKRVQVWLEKQALSSLFEQVTRAEGVDLAVCRGYPSLTYLYEAALDFEGFNEDGHGWGDLLILYFGDFDPSGADIERYVDERLGNLGAWPMVERVAITREQIEQYDIPPAPAKVTDSRYEGFVAEHGVAWQVELDAIEPRVLQGLIRDAIRGRFDVAKGEERSTELRSRRAELQSWLDEALNPDFEPPEEDEE